VKGELVSLQGLNCVTVTGCVRMAPVPTPAHKVLLVLPLPNFYLVAESKDRNAFYRLGSTVGR
jgi:hypothetical protein